MAYENIRDRVIAADAFLDSDRYSDAYQEYHEAVRSIMQVLDQTKTSRKVAKGAGWVAAILTGGLGVEDLLIVPAVNKMVQSLLGIDVKEALALLYRASTQKLLILGLSGEIFDKADTQDVLLDCLICYRLISDNAEKGILDEVIDLANPFSESSPLTGKEVKFSEYQLTEMLYSEMGKSGIKVSYLNNLLYIFLTGKGLTGSKLFHFLQADLNEGSGANGDSGFGQSKSESDAERYGKIFGLHGNVTKDEIRQKYRRFMKDYHPDKYSNASEQEKKDAEEKTKSINEAYSYFKRKFKL